MNLVDSFAEFKEGKSIDRPTLVRLLEDVFKTLIRKKYGSEENFDIIVNPNNGDLEMWRVRAIVPDGEVTDDMSQISESEALSLDDDNEIGDDCYEALSLASFGRRSIMAARQTLISRIMELDKDKIFKKYIDRVGDVVIGEVNQILKREILIFDDATGNELVLPKSEMIRADYFRKGDMVKALIKDVEMRNNNPAIILSRTDVRFLERLLEQEVPEIEDGLITIKKIVRQPGDRAKLAVESYDYRIDPVGACVGMKGSRIHGIVRELKNENIDIINYTENLNLYIQRSLTPANITSIKIDEEKKKASVFLPSDQVSLAIGKGGSNIKLASKLTGYEIEVFRDNVTQFDQEDVDLDEFVDEIEGWVIDEFKNIGCDTARSVLDLDIKELLRRTDLEEETIKDVFKILNAEFEEEGE